MCGPNDDLILNNGIVYGTRSVIDGVREAMVCWVENKQKGKEKERKRYVVQQLR